MAYASIIVPDPHIHVGLCKVLKRTDGLYIAFNTEAPFGKQLMGIFRTSDGCARWLEGKLGMKRELT